MFEPWNSTDKPYILVKSIVSKFTQVKDVLAGGTLQWFGNLKLKRISVFISPDLNLGDKVASEMDFGYHVIVGPVTESQRYIQQNIIQCEGNTKRYFGRFW